ncbi:MAG: hypothetical protein IPJ34_43935 [Myxococcales bacterium]|nr:hypothetical protein [Myxococcales bacterium]
MNENSSTMNSSVAVATPWRLLRGADLHRRDHLRRGVEQVDHHVHEFGLGDHAVVEDLLGERRGSVAPTSAELDPQVGAGPARVVLGGQSTAAGALDDLRGQLGGLDLDDVFDRYPGNRDAVGQRRRLGELGQLATARRVLDLLRLELDGDLEVLLAVLRVQSREADLRQEQPGEVDATAFPLGVQAVDGAVVMHGLLRPDGAQPVEQRVGLGEVERGPHVPQLRVAVREAGQGGGNTAVDLERETGRRQVEIEGQGLLRRPVLEGRRFSDATRADSEDDERDGSREQTHTEPPWCSGDESGERTLRSDVPRRIQEARALRLAGPTPWEQVARSPSRAGVARSPAWSPG